MRTPTPLIRITLVLLLLAIPAVTLLSAEQPRPLSFRSQAMRFLLHSGQRSDAAAAAQRLAMGDTGSISGSVAGLDSSAIGRAYVRAIPVDPVYPKGEYFEGYAEVDSHFTYRIDALPAGDYYVMADAEGYEFQYYRLTNQFGAATAVAVMADSVISGIDFSLVPLVPGTGEISGHVRDEKNFSPVTGAVVYVQTLTEPWYYGKSMTDENGFYQIGELKSGEYLAEVIAEGYVSEIYDDALDYEQATLIPVTEPQSVSGIDFRIGRGGSISGYVFDQNSHPLAGVFVQAEYLRSDSGGWQDPYKSGFMTDYDGYYELTGLRNGACLIRAEYWTSWGNRVVWYPDADTPAGADTLIVENSATYTHMDFVLRVPSPVGTIHGIVRDAEGSPVINANIYLHLAPENNDGSQWVWFSAVTDPQGTYRIEKIPEGVYLAYCYAQNGWQYVHRYWADAESPDGARRIPVDESTPLWQCDFQLPLKQGTASIAGFVRDQYGTALKNAYIQITSAEKGGVSGQPERIYAYASTDSSGFYVVRNLPAGEYIAYASCWEMMNFGQQWFDHAGSESSAARIVLQDRQERSDVHFDLAVRPIYGAIVGVVRDAATGVPIERAYVEIRYQHTETDISFRRYAYWPYYTLTDAAGQYAIDWLPEGAYAVSVYANGSFTAYPDAVVPELGKPVTVIGGEKTVADFNLKRRQDGGNAISGRVTGNYRITPLEEDGAGKRNAGQTMLASTYIPDIAVVMAKPAVTIMLYPQSEMFYTAVTDAEGFYSLKGLPAGEYYVMSFAPGHMKQYYKEQYDPAQAELVRVSGDGEATNIDFVLSQVWYRLKEGDNRSLTDLAANVTGTVRDAQGNALSGTSLYLINSDGQAVSYAISDQNGHYEIIGVPPGAYYLQSGKIGYESNFNGNAPGMEQTAPITLGNGTVTLDITLHVSGGTGIEQPAVPETLVLHGNYPNPFNPETQIRFSLPGVMSVRITIYDRLGREIKRLHDGTLPAGPNGLIWDGRDDRGQAVSSGLYFYRLATNGSIKTGKLVLLR